jgi:broad specificity polyphosphatase/5'/3'-nucleotidase SurE
MESLSASVPAIKWAMKFLQAEAGIDVGEPATQLMLTSLIGVGGVTQAEVDGVKAMALQPASRAEVLFGAEVQITEADVRAALEV